MCVVTSERLADDLLLVTQRGHTYVLDVATGGSAHLDLPEGSALVGMMRGE
jgi:hypothetical protein